MALRTRMPESPRWLLRHARYDEVVFVRKFLPETKGLPVEEVIKVFERQQKSGPLGGSGKPATVTN